MENVMRILKRMVREESCEYECLNEARCWSEGMKLNSFPKIRHIDERVILSGGIDFEPPANKKGGIIVFSTDVNAIRLYPNKIANWIKQTLVTVSNRTTATNKIDKIAKKHESEGWTIGHYLDGSYTAKNGKQFGENSLSVEIVGIDFGTLLHITEDLCHSFEQESLLLKDCSSGRVLFVKPK